MGEAKRKKDLGNFQPNPNWKRKLSSKEICEAVQRGVQSGISGVLNNWNDMIKNK